MIHRQVRDWTKNFRPAGELGIFTGISNGRSEGYNRIVKHVGRIAFGFRNPTNHKRRIRFACTRASRRAANTLVTCRISWQVLIWRYPPR